MLHALSALLFALPISPGQSDRQLVHAERSFLVELCQDPVSGPANTEPDPEQPVTTQGEEEPAPSGSPVPEPATLLLVGTGLVGFALTSRRMRRPEREPSY